MKRDAIVQAVLERMQLITIENNFLTDAGTNAEVDRTDPMDDDEEFLIDIVAGEWETEDQSMQIRRWMNVSVSFACKGSQAIVLRDKIIKDVVASIYADTTWGGLAILTEETGGAADKDTSDVLYAWGEVDMKILYATNEGEI